MNVVNLIPNRLLEPIYQSAVIRNLYAIYVFSFLAATKSYQVGSNIYEQDWDLLIILDACRVDALNTVSAEYDFITSVEQTTSLGSTSKEWLVNTFIQEYTEEIQQTSYISGNGWINLIFREEVDWLLWSSTQQSWLRKVEWISPLVRRDTVDQTAFERLESFSYLGEKHGYKPQPLAEDITNRAIWVGRNQEWNRMIVHYMQPHAPYFGQVVPGDDLTEYEQNPFDALRSGTPKHVVWDAYLNNLRYVLDEVEILLENIDAETVAITADHGELFGEWGVYGHPVGMLHPALRRVPWVETSATDNRTRVPTDVPEPYSETELTRDTEEHLKDLGYFS